MFEKKLRKGSEEFERGESRPERERGRSSERGTQQQCVHELEEKPGDVALEEAGLQLWVGFLGGGEAVERHSSLEEAVQE